MKYKSHSTIFTIVLVTMFALSSCVDYDDVARRVDIQVHLKNPAEFKEDAALDNMEVKIKSKSAEMTAKTDEQGIATFYNCMPDVYDISSYKELTGEEYNQKTGNTEREVESCVITAALNEQLFDEAREQSPVEVDATIMSIYDKIDEEDQIAMRRYIVISKISSSGSKKPTGGNYMAGKYLELYNQSSKAIDISGMYIGLLESTGNANRVYTLEELQTDPAINGTKVVVKQVFRIPTDQPFYLAGGESVLLCNSATDHSDVNELERDLTGADFEAVGVNDNLEHNPNVPKLVTAYTSSGGDATMNLVQGGPCGVIIFDTDEDINTWDKTYGYGKTSGSLTYLLVPKSVIKDGVDFIKNTKDGPNLTTKRLYTDIDAGCTNINAISGYTGEVVYRRTLRVTPEGRKVLMDTNNSSNDFKVSTTIKPREYDNEE